MSALLPAINCADWRWRLERQILHRGLKNSTNGRFQSMIEFEVQRCSRRCAATGRELAEGEEYYSVVLFEGAETVRRDFGAEGWKGAPEGAVAFWKAKVPPRDAKKPRMAPSEVLYELFVRLADDAARADMRYVLTLLLVRGRVLRVERTEKDELKVETLVVYSPRDEITHRVLASVPNLARQDEIQRELTELLFAGAA